MYILNTSFLVSGVTPELEHTDTDVHTKYPIGIKRRTDVEAGYLEDDVPVTSEYIECNMAWLPTVTSPYGFTKAGVIQEFKNFKEYI